MILIGVLVVAVGAALTIMPLSHRSPLRAKRRQCQSSLKQLALSCALYVADFDDRHPQINGSTNGVFGWGDALLPYLRHARSATRTTG